MDPPSRSNWTQPREAIGPKGPIASRGGSIPVFLGKNIATEQRDFPGERWPRHPVPPPAGFTHENILLSLLLYICK